MAGRYVVDVEDGSGDGPHNLLPSEVSHFAYAELPLARTPPDQADSKSPHHDICEVTDDILIGYESHFNWISHRDLTEEDIIRLRSKWDKYLEEFQKRALTFCDTVSGILVDFILDYELGNKNGYSKALLDLETTLSKFPEDLPREHLVAYSYYELIFKVNILHRLGKPKEASRLFAQLLELDLENNRTKAAILVLKSKFFAILGLPEEKRDMLLKAIRMDPNFSEWYGSLYMALRCIRRERFFLSPPEDDEIIACQTSYKLDNSSHEQLSMMSMLYEDILKASKYNGAPIPILVNLSREEMSRQMVLFARGACEQNPDHFGYNVRLAEMLGSGSIGNDLTDLEGSEKQFELCLEKWPNNSHVLHKMGKFFISVKSDWVRGMECFKQALMADADNFPCLMDYLRGLFQKNYRSDDPQLKFTELIAILDAQIPLFRLRNVLCGKLKSMKAALLWKLGREKEAVDLWLEALEKDQNLCCEGVINVMGGGSVFVKLLTSKDFQKIVQTMNTRKETETDPREINGGKPLQTFVEALEKDFEKWSLGVGGNRNWRPASDQQGKTGHRTRYESEGDLATDWRSQSSSSGFSNTGDASDASQTKNSPRPDENGMPQPQPGRPETGIWKDASVPLQNNSSNKGYGHGSGWNGSRVGDCTRDRRVNYSSESSTQPPRYQRRYDSRKQTLSASDIDDNWRRQN